MAKSVKHEELWSEAELVALFKDGGAERFLAIPKLEDEPGKGALAALRIAAEAYVNAALTEAELTAQTDAKAKLGELDEEYAGKYTARLGELFARLQAGELGNLAFKAEQTKLEADNAKDKAKAGAKHSATLARLSSKRGKAALEAVHKLYKYNPNAGTGSGGTGRLSLGEATVRALRNHAEFGRLEDGSFVVKGVNGETVSLGKFDASEEKVDSRSKCCHLNYAWNTRDGDWKEKSERTQNIIANGNLTNRQMTGSVGASGYTEGLPEWVDKENVVSLEEYMRKTAKQAAEAAKAAKAKK